MQPLLPAFAADFRISPAASSLALSSSTFLLALAILAASAFSQACDRRGLMGGSMILAAGLNLAAALAPGWSSLLVVRALEGLALGGVPAVAMAYLAEEIDPAHLGRAMGRYVAGTAFGGMMGRVGMGLLLGALPWRGAMAVLGGLDLAAALAFLALLPLSRNVRPSPLRGLVPHLRAWSGHLRSAPLRRLFAAGFLLTGSFVTLFNYAGFRLAAPPYRLGPTAVSLVFLAYAFGMAASSTAGGLADRHGRGRVLRGAWAVMLGGLALTLSASLPLIVLGVVGVTLGFFAAHAVASAWVGATARQARGHATALYLLSYYLGSSLVGSGGGWAWSHGGWPGIVALTGGLALIGLLLH